MNKNIENFTPDPTENTSPKSTNVKKFNPNRVIPIRENLALKEDESYTAPMQNNGGDMGGTDGRFTSLEKDVGALKQDVSELKQEFKGLRTEVLQFVTTVKLWLLGTMLTTIGVGVAVATFQAMWFQKSLDRNWEVAQKSLDKIDSTIDRMATMEAKLAVKTDAPTPQAQPSSVVLVVPNASTENTLKTIPEPRK